MRQETRIVLFTCLQLVSPSFFLSPSFSAVLDFLFLLENKALISLLLSLYQHSSNCSKVKPTTSKFPQNYRPVYFQSSYLQSYLFKRHSAWAMTTVEGLLSCADHVYEDGSCSSPTPQWSFTQEIQVTHMWCFLPDFSQIHWPGVQRSQGDKQRKQ